MSGFAEAVKRAFDVVGSLVALTVTGPLLAIIAVALRLDSPGPAFFHQERLGKDGRPFSLIKFRTMVVDAPPLRSEDGSWINPEHDPRVTRVGALLRRSSLDEVPQLINILKGEMSFVGPRPDPTEALALYRPGDLARLTVKPGLTGWAAVNGRNSIGLEQRRDLDLEYVAQRSLWMDARILVRSVLVVLRGEGVHVSVSPPTGS